MGFWGEILFILVFMCHWNRGINPISLCRGPGLMLQSASSAFRMAALLPMLLGTRCPIYFLFFFFLVFLYRTNCGTDKREITRETWSCLACWFNKCYGLWQWGFYFSLQRFSDSSFLCWWSWYKADFSIQFNFSTLLLLWLTKLKMFSLTSIWSNR